MGLLLFSCRDLNVNTKGFYGSIRHDIRRTIEKPTSTEINYIFIPTLEMLNTQDSILKIQIKSKL